MYFICALRYRAKYRRCCPNGNYTRLEQLFKTAKITPTVNQVECVSYVFYIRQGLADNQYGTLDFIPIWHRTTFGITARNEALCLPLTLRAVSLRD